MRKKMIVGLLVALLSLQGFGFANVDTSITLDEALVYALDNPQFDILEKRIELAENELKSAEFDAEDVYIARYMDEEERLNLTFQENLTPLEKEFAIEKLERQRDDLIVDLENQAYDLYHQIKATEFQLATEKEFLSTAERELSNAKLRLEKGLITQLDYDQLDLALSQRQQSISALENQLENQLYSFKQLINYDLITKVTLASPIDTKPVVIDYDLEKIEEYKLDGITEIVNLERELELLEYKVELILDEADDDADLYDDTQDEIIDAEEALLDAERSARFDLYTEYNNLLNAKNTSEINKMTFDYDKRLFASEKLKYDLGMITYVELQATHNDLVSDYLAYIESRVDLMTKMRDFESKYHLDVPFPEEPVEDAVEEDTAEESTETEE